ncbi:MAG: hypothetical protein AAFN04_10755 [Pseudomonadota bacterium]
MSDTSTTPPDTFTSVPGDDTRVESLDDTFAELTAEFEALRNDPALKELEEIFRQKERDPPRVVTPSSFLYMRTLFADQGDRPLAPGRHWHSPDLTLTPVSTPGQPTTELIAGETYEIACTLRNRGDLRVPSAQVELFLTDPTLGFDTRQAVNLTAGRPMSGNVPGFGTTTLTFPYKVPDDEGGHKCLFARTYAFFPHEIPVDPHRLDPRMDRRIAQQNLMIAAADQPFPFQVVHPLNGRIAIDIAPIAADVGAGFERIAAARLEVLEASEFPIGEIAGLIDLEDGRAVALDQEDDGLLLTASGDGPGPGQRIETESAMARAIADRATGRIDAAAFTRLRDAYRANRNATGVTKLVLQAPDFGLGGESVFGIEITARDTDLHDAPLGGIIVFFGAPGLGR